MSMRARLGVLLAVSLAVCSTASADFSINKATIDWSSLTITGPEIVWLAPPDAPSRFSLSEADASHWTSPTTRIKASDKDRDYPWTDTHAVAQVSGARGEGGTSGSSLWAYATAYDMEDASAHAVYEGQFLVTEDGTLTFSVDYTLEQHVHRSDDNWTFGWALASLTMGNTSTPDTLSDLDMDEKEWFVVDLSANRGPAGGTLSVSLPFQAYETGGFTAEVLAASEAYPYEEYVEPAPPAVLLGAIGLAITGAIRRRLRRAPV